MDWKTFFKPTKWTIGLFIVFIVLSFFFFRNTDIRIFPCKVQTIMPNPPAFKDSVCGLEVYLGVRQVFTPLGYFMIILMLLVLPYLLACIANSLIKRK